MFSGLSLSVSNLLLVQTLVLDDGKVWTALASGVRLLRLVYRPSRYRGNYWYDLVMSSGDDVYYHGYNLEFYEICGRLC